MLMAACTSENELERGTIGFVDGFFGGVAAAEPTAALVGRDILTAGGNAVDAAVGVTLALSVTYPSAVSLGGGGTCLVHDTVIGITEALDFIPPAGTGQGTRPSAIPTLARGMAALHSRYGEFQWGELVSPAERLARLGHRVSRAFARDVLLAAEPLYSEPSVRTVFSGPNGRLVSEGDLLVQPDLAAILGQIRVNGAGALYNGRLARAFVDSVQQVGGTLTMDELTGYTPNWRSSILVPYGDDEMHFAPPPAAAGPVQANIWLLLTAGDRYAEADEAERAHLLAEVTKRTSADRKDWLSDGFMTGPDLENVIDPDRVASLMDDFDPEGATSGAEIDPQRRESIEVISGTGFVVTDSQGMTVACSLSLFNPFGAGRVAPGTGILLAAAPGQRGRNPLGLGPIISINSINLTTRFAVASGGGPLAIPGSIQIAADTLLGGMSLADAMKAPRQFAVETPDTVLVEDDGGDALAAHLSARNHPVERLSWRGQVSAIHCPLGLGEASEDRICEVVQDPRGSGLAAFSRTEN